MSISVFLVYLPIADFVDFARIISHFLAAVGIPLTPNFDFLEKHIYPEVDQFFPSSFIFGRQSLDDLNILPSNKPH